MSTTAGQSFRCETCKSTSENPCNLVVFIDGTSNKFGPKNTNVIKLFRQVETENTGSQLLQHKNYWSGIGSQSGSWIETLFAPNVEDNVKDAYGWLVGKFQKGAQIYLFGFSRGAYQVRILAGLIHEVGLVKDKGHIEIAYGQYQRIHTGGARAREMATEYKKTFCWPDVRIHFVGVWDTVSSVGLTKKDTFISASASTTNACYFRHALALDERRVKFLPEYFVEINSHRKDEAGNNVIMERAQEVWFAGSHSDVGGSTRPDHTLLSQHENELLYHAGHVSFLWMRREASANGLVLEPEDIVWIPDDITHGRLDSMTVGWWALEMLPIRYQVSFNGAGEHERRSHWFQPRRIIPTQKIHISVLFGDEYTPSATLGNGIDVPAVPRRTVKRIPDGGLWATELPDEEATTRLLTSLLSDKSQILDSLERVLFLLESKKDSTWVQRMPDWPRPFEDFIHGHSDFPKLALIIIYFIASDFSISEDLMYDAGEHLKAILCHPKHPDGPRTLSILRFLTRYPTLSSNDLVSCVIEALMCALGWTVSSPNTNFFPLVVDNFCNLIDNDSLRERVVLGLCENATPASSDSRFSLMFRVKASNQLMASLRMIISLVLHKRADICRQWEYKVLELAQNERGRVGAMAVEAFVALNPSQPLTLDLHFSNILRYLCNSLPHLDVENDNVEPDQGNLSAPDDGSDVSHSYDRLMFDDEILEKLVSTAESWDTQERTAAILVLLKLCERWKTQDRIRSEVLDIFVTQLQQKKTSLLAMYAVKTCLKKGMEEYIDLGRVAPLIVAMLKKGWFDDAIGRVEGFGIFRELMKHANLKQRVIQSDIMADLVKKLESGKHDEIRTVLISLQTLVGDESKLLEDFVIKSLDYLRNPRRKIQEKGVKILSALAQMTVGEQAIRPHLTKIVEMLLPQGYSETDALSVPSSPIDSPQDDQNTYPTPDAQAFGPIAAIYALSRNDTLRREIQGSATYASFKHLHHTNAHYHWT